MTPPTTSAFVNTRGRVRHRDYDFLCASPPEAWWRAYAGHTTFERPTILAESDGARHRIYLSGIPSRRRDAVGSTIRYTVVVENAPGRAVDPAAADPGGLVALVACWLADLNRAGAAAAVSTALDTAFPEADVERWLARPDPAGGLQVQQRLLDAIRSLPPPVRTKAPAAPPDWVGDLGWPPARAAFVERVRELVADRPGRAAVLNLVDSPSDVAPLLDDGRPLAVLAPDLAAPTTITALRRERVDAGKKALPPPRTALPVPGPAAAARRVDGLIGCLRLVIWPLVLVLAVGISVAAALLTR